MTKPCCVAAGKPPAAEGTPHIAGTTCFVALGKPPAAEGTIPTASTTRHKAAGKPLEVEGKSPVASTICEIPVNVPVVGNEEIREYRHWG